MSNITKINGLLISADSASYVLTASYIDPVFISASAASSGFGSGGSMTTAATASLALRVSQSQAQSGSSGVGIFRVALLDPGIGAIQADSPIYYDHNGLTYNQFTNTLTVGGAINIGAGITASSAVTAQTASIAYRVSSSIVGDTSDYRLAMFAADSQALVRTSGVNISYAPSQARLSVTQILATGITASFLGTASLARSASYAQTASVLQITNTTTGTGPYYPVFVDATSGNLIPRIDSTTYVYNATTNTINVTASFAVTSSYPFKVTGSNTLMTMYSNTSPISNMPLDNCIAIGDQTGGPRMLHVYMLGNVAGSSASDSTGSVFIGNGAGSTASGSKYNNFIGQSAGAFINYDTSYTNAIGWYAGFTARQSQYSNFIGAVAGQGAGSSSIVNYIGYNAGAFARSVTGSNFIGYYAGGYSNSASYSTILGWGAGVNPTFNHSGSIGQNNIIIGTGITLPRRAKDSINIGGILFGTGSYFDTQFSSSFSGSAGGRIGINVVSPAYNFQVSGSVAFPNLTTTNQSNIVTVNTSTGQLFYTASSAYTTYNGAWTSYTPTWTSAGTQPTLGDGTLTGAYKQIGNTVFVRVRLTFGTTTNGGTGAWYFDLPVTASSTWGIQMPVSILDNGNAWYQATANGEYGGFTHKTAIIGQSAGGANSSQGIEATFPMAWGNLDSLQFNGSYESV